MESLKVTNPTVLPYIEDKGTISLVRPCVAAYPVGTLVFLNADGKFEVVNDKLAVACGVLTTPSLEADGEATAVTVFLAVHRAKVQPISVAAFVRSYGIITIGTETLPDYAASSADAYIHGQILTPPASNIAYVGVFRTPVVPSSIL